MWLCGRGKVSAPCTVAAVERTKGTWAQKKTTRGSCGSSAEERSSSGADSEKGTEAVFHTASTARYASKTLCTSMGTILVPETTLINISRR